MKNYFSLISLALVFTFSSCKEEEATKPKVIYENNSKSKAINNSKKTPKEVADLPILMEGTNYLIYPIGKILRDKKGIKSSYSSEDSFTISNYGEYQITGYLSNLKFQEINKDTIYSLTDKPIFIETVTYLKTFSDKTKLQLLVYTIRDNDTNKDVKLDSDDINALYISDISGKNFTKITADFQELIDWKVLEVKSRIYFRTIDDTNKNGEFDKSDTIHYFFLNLLDKEWKAQEYNPI
jgi:hypothetical protein